ncbi:MAG: peroxiredoxin-like family protein [Aestuariivirgaceae bacterium]
MSPRTLAEICVMDAPLWRRLELYVETQREEGSPFAAASDELVARLKAGVVGERAPAVGETMPDVILPDQHGHLVGLHALAETGPVVLSFNRGHWCPFCHIELTALAEAHADLVELGAKVVSIMPDRQAYLGRLPDAAASRLTILADIDCGYSLSLGLVMWLGDRLKDLMLGFGVSLEEIHGNRGWMVPVPATFILDSRARVAARAVEHDFRRRMDIEDIKAALASCEANSKRNVT